MLRLQSHAIEHIYETDNLIDEKRLAEILEAAGPLINKKEFEDVLTSFGLACAEMGLHIGYGYGAQPHKLIGETK